MANLVIRDKNGAEVTYEGVEKVKFNTTDGGTQLYSEGEAMENIPIALSFSEGDQTVEAPSGYLVKSAVIAKPENLTPENIREGESIAGIEGTLPAYEVLENVPIALDFSTGNQAITVPDGNVVKSAIIQQPETLMPENIAEGVDIAGIIGTLAKGKNVIVEKGTFTGAEGETTVNHNLGVVPDIVYLYTPTGMANGAKQNYIVACVGMSLTFAKAFAGSYYNSYGQFGIVKYSSASGSETTYSRNGHCIDNTSTSTDKLINNATTTSFVVGNSTNKARNVAYTWFAIGGLT